jgi:hypothetical protein
MEVAMFIKEQATENWCARLLGKALVIASIAACIILSTPLE